MWLEYGSTIGDVQKTGWRRGLSAAAAHSQDGPILSRLLRAVEEEIDHAVVGSYDEDDFARMRTRLESLGYL